MYLKEAREDNKEESRNYVRPGHVRRLCRYVRPVKQKTDGWAYLLLSQP